jgi:hypothetical protein
MRTIDIDVVLKRFADPDEVRELTKVAPRSCGWAARRSVGRWTNAGRPCRSIAIRPVFRAPNKGLMALFDAGRLRTLLARVTTETQTTSAGRKGGSP